MAPFALVRRQHHGRRPQQYRARQSLHQHPYFSSQQVYPAPRPQGHPTIVRPKHPVPTPGFA
jgi:hypothetical protein